MKLPTLSATVAFAIAAVLALLAVISAVLGATGGAVVCVAGIQLLVLLGGHEAQPTKLDQVVQEQREALARLELRITAADERAVTEARATTKELSALIAAQRG